MDENDGGVRPRCFRSSADVAGDLLARSGICNRRRDYAELCCSYCRCRSTNETPAIVVDFVGHESSIALAACVDAPPLTLTSAIRRRDQIGYRRRIIPAITSRLLPASAPSRQRDDRNHQHERFSDANPAKARFHGGANMSYRVVIEGGVCQERRANLEGPQG